MEKIIVITGIVSMLVVLSFCWAPEDSSVQKVLILLNVVALGSAFLLGLSFITKEMYWPTLVAMTACIASFHEGLRLSRNGSEPLRTLKHSALYVICLAYFWLFLPLGNLVRN